MPLNLPLQMHLYLSARKCIICSRKLQVGSRPLVFDSKSVVVQQLPSVLRLVWGKELLLLSFRTFFCPPAHVLLWCVVPFFSLLEYRTALSRTLYIYELYIFSFSFTCITSLPILIIYILELLIPKQLSQDICNITFLTTIHFCNRKAEKTSMRGLVCLALALLSCSVYSITTCTHLCL